MKQEDISIKALYKAYSKHIIMTGVVLLTLFIALLLIHVLRPQLILTIPEAQSIIFIDNERRGYTIQPNETHTFFVGPGVHSVIVASDEMWPWNKEILFSVGERARFTTFNLPVDRADKIVPQNNESYPELNALRDGVSIHNATSTDESIVITTDGSRLTAEWKNVDEEQPAAFCATGMCLNSIQVLNSDAVIGDIAFMGDRNDVILFESAGNINAIELDREGTQNYQPLYVGRDPELLKVTPSGIYIYDRDAIRFISFSR